MKASEYVGNQDGPRIRPGVTGMGGLGVQPPTVMLLLVMSIHEVLQHVVALLPTFC
mgnify:CR=1 FL=1